MNTTNAALIGVPLDLGAENLGVDIGANAFRYQGIADKLAGAGITVEDRGNIACPERSSAIIGDDSRLKHLDEIVKVSEATATAVAEAIQNGRKAIVLGGDHSVCLGAVAGAASALGPEIGLIYFDAHGDMNTHETTLTGNIHGMHLASLLGFGAPELINVRGEGAKIRKENLLHIAGSDFDQAELDLIQREGLDAFTLFDLLSQGLSPLFKKIDDLTARCDQIWISLDLDSIDRIYAPGAGMPNAKGLTYREISTIAEYIGRHGNVAGIDVVEYNPLQDEMHKTAELGIELIATFFGHNYSWYAHYLAQNKL